MWCSDLLPWMHTEVTPWLTEQACLPGLDWFRIHPSVCLHLWLDVWGGGRTGLVNLPLPASGISAPFLQVPSA